MAFIKGTMPRRDQCQASTLMLTANPQPFTMTSHLKAHYQIVKAISQPMAAVAITMASRTITPIGRCKKVEWEETARRTASKTGLTVEALEVSLFRDRIENTHRWLCSLESQNLYSYGTVAQFPQSSNGYSASITEVQDILNRVMAPVDVPLGNFNTSSSSGPWNPYKVSIDQNTSADQVMFAPDIHYNLESSLAPGAYLDTGHLPDEVNSNTRFRPQINLQSQQVSLEKSMDNLPSTNPVGPSNLLVGNTTHKIKKVPKTEGKGRRHKCLSPHRRAEVRIMRKRGACWHCKCMREKVDIKFHECFENMLIDEFSVTGVRNVGSVQ